MIKFILPCIMLILALISCEKEYCVSCVVQQNVSKDIIESRAVCDKSSDYVNGFGDGVKKKYEGMDTVSVVCGY